MTPLLAALLALGVAVDDELPEEARPPPPEEAPAAAPDHAQPEGEAQNDAYFLTIGGVLEERNDEIQACARPAQGQKWVEGDVELSWRISEDGVPSDAKVLRNDTGREGVGSCLAELVTREPFPPPPRGDPVVVRRRFQVTAPAETGGFFGWIAGLFGCG
jgi:hypothetical protein